MRVSDLIQALSVALMDDDSLNLFMAYIKKRKINKLKYICLFKNLINYSQKSFNYLTLHIICFILASSALLTRTG